MSFQHFLFLGVNPKNRTCSTHFDREITVIRPAYCVCVLLLLFLSSCASQTTDISGSSFATELAGKYSPAGEKVMVFVGQDNASVGGSEQWQKGYIDRVGVPAGITHYVYFTEGKQNPGGFDFDIGSVDGLNSVTTWGAGPMCMRCYLESPSAEGMVIHLSISMEHDDEEQVAAGDYDNNIMELAAFLNEFSGFPFIIRIGYEFDGVWNHYEPEAFKRAWRRIVDRLRAEGADNFATLLGSSTMALPLETWQAYWPGDDYVDWLGYSYWSGGSVEAPVLDLAREKGMPVFIGEASTRGFQLDQIGELVWYDWFDVFFAHIEENKDVIKAISYINANWNAQPMWRDAGWGVSEIQTNEAVLKRWKEKMEDPLYIHGTENLYRLIDFQ